MAIVVKEQMRSLSIAAAALLVAGACSASAPTKRVRVTTSPVSVQATAPAGGRLLLHLNDVQVPDGEAAMLRVFVNNPSATAATSTSAPGFVEEMFLVPRSSQARGSASHPGQNFVLPIPTGIKGGERITITLVPVAANERGELTAPGTVHLSMRPPTVTSN